jgi:hypothetical protein
MRHLGWRVGFIGFLALGGCGPGASSSGPQVPAASSALSAARVGADDAHPRNPQAFEPHSAPFGTSMERWSERLWQWIYSIPTGSNPFLDTTGADCGVQQPSGDVWYLPPVPDPGGTASFTRSCTIPRGRALLLLTSGVLNDFPCPDPSFKPADGQTLYEFLLAGAQGGPNSLTAQSLSVDGVVLKHIFDYRETSDDLFQVTGDISLQTSLDGCITGTPQPAVSDAFVLMLRPLPPGAHTLIYKAADTHGTNLTVTFQLAIQ